MQAKGRRLIARASCGAVLALAAVAVAGASASGVARTASAGKTVLARKTVVTVAGKPSEFKFTLSKTRVPAGTVTFEITDRGALPHDFEVCAKGGRANSCAGKKAALLTPGKSESLRVSFGKRGTYEYLCTVPGHAAAGMKGDLKVT